MMDILAANREEKLLLAHVEDLWARAESGVLSHTAYLSPGEQMICRSFLQSRGGNENDSFLFYGGFAYAERRLLFCLPDYLSPCFNGQESDTKMSDWLLSQCEDSSGIAAVLIRGSGFCSLTHRDYLGAVLGLGIDRSLIGDILVRGKHAWFICLSSAADMLVSSLSQVRRTTVIAAASNPDIPELQPRFAPLRFNVASERLDTVVAAFAGLSRGQAEKLFSAEKVFVNGRTVTDKGARLKPGDILSVRGFGKAVYDGVEYETRKNRLWVSLRKYI